MKAYPVGNVGDYEMAPSLAWFGELEWSRDGGQIGKVFLKRVPQRL